jgi:hypothetical protein
MENLFSSTRMKMMKHKLKTLQLKNITYQETEMLKHCKTTIAILNNDLNWEGSIACKRIPMFPSYHTFYKTKEQAAKQNTLFLV